MTIWELKTNISKNIFSYLDVVKFFPNEDQKSLRIQLSRFIKRGHIGSFKREWYFFDREMIDQFEISSLLYKPSYISLETALNYHGVIPDIPQTVTALTPTTTKKFDNIFGSFSYSKINSTLFFGFDLVNNYFMAKKEKALLDYFYIRKVKSISDLRLNLDNFDLARYTEYKSLFPRWIPNL